MAELLEAIRHLDTHRAVILVVALTIAFGFEVINGFHDTANAVTTVIYTRTLRPMPAVFFSGFCNFLGVLLGGTAIAFSIVHLLPVDLLINATSQSAIIMVLALLTSGMAWNLATWWLGLPVSSSHTLIGAILGLGMANSFLTGQGALGSVNWAKAGEVGLALLISPLIGFAAAAILLLTAKRWIRDHQLYDPPPANAGARPPGWIRAILLLTCGGVSLAHGSNDGQKGMGLIMLVLLGLAPAVYALNLKEAGGARSTQSAAKRLKVVLTSYESSIPPEELHELDTLIETLDGKTSLREVPLQERWQVHSTIFQLGLLLQKQQLEHPSPGRSELDLPRQELRNAIEYVPTWVVVGVAVCLGIGTTIGYKRIVVTIAEKIGKTHLTYAQGASAELVAMATIGLADVAGFPVSTTHVLSSGVAGTMWANRSGIQMTTIRKIGLAWILTLPGAMLLAAVLYLFGHLSVGH
jgi:phosphate/sulfate permease